MFCFFIVSYIGNNWYQIQYPGPVASPPGYTNRALLTLYRQYTIEKYTKLSANFLVAS